MNKLFVALTALALIMSGFAIYQSGRSPKVAYIRSAEMIYSYDGMKEAQKNYQKKLQMWQANVDTLRIELERNFNSYTQEARKLSEKEKVEQERLLNIQQQNYNKYAQAIQEKSQQEEKQMTEGVLNQINSFVEAYSKSNDYDLVIGTTTSGNLLYGKEYMDITESVLKALNENYRLPADK